MSSLGELAQAQPLPVREVVRGRQQQVRLRVNSGSNSDPGAPEIVGEGRAFTEPSRSRSTVPSKSASVT